MAKALIGYLDRSSHSTRHTGAGLATENARLRAGSPTSRRPPCGWPRRTTGCWPARPRGSRSRRDDPGCRPDGA